MWYIVKLFKWHRHRVILRRSFLKLLKWLFLNKVTVFVLTWILESQIKQGQVCAVWAGPWFHASARASASPAGSGVWLPPHRQLVNWPVTVRKTRDSCVRDGELRRSGPRDTRHPFALPPAPQRWRDAAEDHGARSGAGEPLRSTEPGESTALISSLAHSQLANLLFVSGWGMTACLEVAGCERNLEKWLRTRSLGPWCWHTRRTSRSTGHALRALSPTDPRVLSRWLRSISTAGGGGG